MTIINIRVIKAALVLWCVSFILSSSFFYCKIWNFIYTIDIMVKPFSIVYIESLINFLLF